MNGSSSFLSFRVSIQLRAEPRENRPSITLYRCSNASRSRDSLEFSSEIFYGDGRQHDRPISDGDANPSRILELVSVLMRAL